MSVNRIFRIDFYPQDWLIDTASLPPDERGIYIQIIALIYSNRGPIQNDPQWIAGLSGCSTRMAKALIEKLFVKKFLTLNSDGKIGQKRAENELRIKREHLEQSANGGRKAAEKKGNPKENSALASTEAQSSVPSSSPTATATATDESAYADSLAQDEAATTSEQKPKKERKPKAPKPDDVPFAIWEDWLRHRKAKNAPTSGTIIDHLRTQGGILGWPLSEVMREQINRNWQGFKADWILRDQQNARGNSQISNQQRVNEEWRQAHQNVRRMNDKAAETGDFNDIPY